MLFACVYVTLFVYVIMCCLHVLSWCVVHPQAITLLTALTLARDEVFWLYKHSGVTPPKAKGRLNPDDYTDPSLPELIFLILQLKGVAHAHM